MLNIVAKREDELPAIHILHVVGVYISEAETTRRSIKRQLFGLMCGLTNRLSELTEPLETGKERLFTRFAELMAHCTINEKMREECERVLKESD